MKKYKIYNIAPVEGNLTFSTSNEQELKGFLQACLGRWDTMFVSVESENGKVTNPMTTFVFDKYVR